MDSVASKARANPTNRRWPVQKSAGLRDTFKHKNKNNQHEIRSKIGRIRKPNHAHFQTYRTLEVVPLEMGDLIGGPTYRTLYGDTKQATGGYKQGYKSAQSPKWLLRGL